MIMYSWGREGEALEARVCLLLKNSGSLLRAVNALQWRASPRGNTSVARVPDAFAQQKAAQATL